MKIRILILNKINNFNKMKFNIQMNKSKRKNK